MPKQSNDEMSPRLSGETRLFLAGNTLSMFGTGLVLPFMIIYLHEARGIALPVVGALLAAGAATGLMVVLRFRRPHPPAQEIAKNPARTIGHAARGPTPARSCYNARCRFHPGLAAPATKSEPQPGEQTMIIHQYLAKAVQDDAQRAGERDRLLLEAQRARMPHPPRAGPAAPVRRLARLLFRRAAA